MEGPPTAARFARREVAPAIGIVRMLAVEVVFLQNQIREPIIERAGRIVDVYGESFFVGRMWRPLRAVLRPEAAERLAADQRPGLRILHQFDALRLSFG